MVWVFSLSIFAFWFPLYIVFYSVKLSKLVNCPSFLKEDKLVWEVQFNIFCRFCFWKYLRNIRKAKPICRSELWLAQNCPTYAWKFEIHPAEMHKVFSSTRKFYGMLCEDAISDKGTEIRMMLRLTFCVVICCCEWHCFPSESHPVIVPELAGDK